jgi:SAM-dependent methyltransferase
MADAADAPRDVVLGLINDDSALLKATLSGRQRNRTVPYRRVELRYVDLSAGRFLQVTTYTDTLASTRNVAVGSEAVREVEEQLDQGYANWTVSTTTETVNVRITKKGRPLLQRSARTSPAEPDRAHDRPKRRRLDDGDELFEVLGIAEAGGRVKPSRMAKFRQVQDFLAALDPVVDDAVALGPGQALSEQRPLRVVDLGCGNAYLTFAALRYLSVVKDLPVDVVGIDVKAQAHGHNADAADRLGVGGQIRFVDSTIRDAPLDDAPDLVLALHACDTATDEALARAVLARAPVLLAAPCCHHDIQRQLAAVEIAPAYRLVTKHGILRERLADVLTDAFRAAILRIVGYRVDVIEFVGSEHTPRNALIRAVRTDAAPSPDTVAAYHALLSEWRVRPSLGVMVQHRYPLLDPDLVAARD